MLRQPNDLQKYPNMKKSTQTHTYKTEIQSSWGCSQGTEQMVKCQNKHLFLCIFLRECWWERTADEPKGCHWPKSLQCSLVRWFIYMIIDGQYSYLSRCADGRWQLRSQKALSLSKKPPMLISQMVYIYDNRWGISMHVLIILTRIDLHVLIILTRIDHLRSCHSNVSEAEIRQLHVQTC